MSESAIVVIGASAGGVEALRKLAGAFPENFDGSVFVVLHIDNSESRLPEVLSAAGSLPAVHPLDGQRIKKGVIYVAPPDHMLLSEPNIIRLSHGPKENYTRPAINPTFRSAATVYGSAVTGVILSGNLDDGVLGLAEIKNKGGLAIAQDPKTALYPSMPSRAIESVPIDYIASVEDIPELISRNGHGQQAIEGFNLEQRKTDLTCPECRGPISEVGDGKLMQYRCRVGHAYSALAFAHEHQNTVERKLWESVLVLDESAEVADRLHLQFGGNYRQVANERRTQAALLRDILNDMNAIHIGTDSQQPPSSPA